MSTVDKLASLFGGLRPLARELGVHHTLITRWKKHGMVPPNHNAAIKEAALRRELPMEEVEACLVENVCPCCRQALGVGVVVDRRHFKAA